MPEWSAEWSARRDSGRYLDARRGTGRELHQLSRQFQLLAKSIGQPSIRCGENTLIRRSSPSLPVPRLSPSKDSIPRLISPPRPHPPSPHPGKSYILHRRLSDDDKPEEERNSEEYRGSQGRSRPRDLKKGAMSDVNLDGVTKAGVRRAGRDGIQRLMLTSNVGDHKENTQESRCGRRKSDPSPRRVARASRELSFMPLAGNIKSHLNTFYVDRPIISRD